MNVARTFRVRVCVLALVALACDATTAPAAGDGGLSDAPMADAPAAIDAGADAAAMPAVDWRDQIIYLVMTDRFANGDSSNDSLGLPNCLDPADPQKFHGGDFAGLAG